MLTRDLLSSLSFSSASSFSLFSRKFIHLVLEKIPPPVDFFHLDFKFCHGLLEEGSELATAAKQTSHLSRLECRKSLEAEKSISLLDFTIIINLTYLLIFLSKLSKRLRTSLEALLLSLMLLLQPTTRQALQTL